MDEGEFAGVIGCPHLGNVDVEGADGISLEPLFGGFVVLGFRQAADAEALPCRT